jgi:hypothetical protein
VVNKELESIYVLPLTVILERWFVAPTAPPTVVAALTVRANGVAPALSTVLVNPTVLDVVFSVVSLRSVTAPA